MFAVGLHPSPPPKRKPRGPFNAEQMTAERFKRQARHIVLVPLEPSRLSFGLDRNKPHGSIIRSKCNGPSIWGIGGAGDSRGGSDLLKFISRLKIPHARHVVGTDPQRLLTIGRRGQRAAQDTRCRKIGYRPFSRFQLTSPPVPNFNSCDGQHPESW